MRVGRHSEFNRFGNPAQIGVERGITEFRAGRPVLIFEKERAFLAMPVDGLDADRLAAFVALCGGRRPRLAVTGQRGRAIGIKTLEPIVLKL